MEIAEKLRMYVPDGHLEDFVMNLLDVAGFDPRKKKRSYLIETNSNEWVFKQTRPQDQPFYVGNGYGELCIVGQDIFKEFSLKYPELSSKVEILEVFSGRPTRLVAVVSLTSMGHINDLKEFFLEKGESARIASEYPEIVKDYIKKEFGLDIDIYRPAGKTEALLRNPRPEFDLVVDTAETGTSIKENRGKIIGNILEESRQVVVVNTQAYSDPVIKEEIDIILEQFRGVMRAKTDKLHKIQMNVLKKEDINRVIDRLRSEGYNPTVSEIVNGGADIFVIIAHSRIKKLVPELNKLGCTDIAVTKLGSLLYPSSK